MLNLSLVRLFRKDYLTSMRIILTNVWLKHKGISELKIFSFQAWSWYDMNINWTTLIMINMNRIISSVQIPADQTLKVTNLDKINNIFSRPALVSIENVPIISVNGPLISSNFLFQCKLKSLWRFSDLIIFLSPTPDIAADVDGICLQPNFII